MGRGEPSPGAEVGFYQAGSEPRLHERGNRRHLAMDLQEERHGGCYEGYEARSLRVRRRSIWRDQKRIKLTERMAQNRHRRPCGDGPKSTMRFECFISRRKWLAHLCGRAGMRVHVRARVRAGGQARGVRLQTSGMRVWGAGRCVHTARGLHLTTRRSSGIAATQSAHARRARPTNERTTQQ